MMIYQVVSDSDSCIAQLDPEPGHLQYNVMFKEPVLKEEVTLPFDATLNLTTFDAFCKVKFFIWLSWANASLKELYLIYLSVSHSCLPFLFFWRVFLPSAFIVSSKMLVPGWTSYV